MPSPLTAHDREVADCRAVIEDGERGAEPDRETHGGRGDPSSVGADPAKRQPLGGSDHQSCHRAGSGSRPQFVYWSYDCLRAMPANGNASNVAAHNRMSLLLN
jgi:hypothetical protein